MKHKITKIIALITLIMFCILFCCDYIFAVSIRIPEDEEFTKRLDMDELEKKYDGYLNNAFLITIIALPLIFLILLKYKKNKVIKKVYIILLIAVMVGFILAQFLAQYFISKKYYYDHTILDMILYMILDMTIPYALIGFIILKMILSYFNNLKMKDIIIIDSVPEISFIITFLMIYLFDWVCSKNYGFEYTKLLLFWFGILILSNLAMLPIYLLKEEKIKKVKNENTRN